MLVLEAGRSAGLTPIASNSVSGKTYPLSQSDWSIASPSGAAEVHLSQSVKYAACLHAMGTGLARVTCRVVTGGKSLEVSLDVQVVVPK
jgi:hypothetical protein